MLLRVCPGCGRLKQQTGRCAACKRADERKRPKTAARGYGSRHQRLARLAITRSPVCEACGSEHELTADHVIPVAHGGCTTLGNYRVLCRTCNSRRGATTRRRTA